MDGKKKKNRSSSVDVNETMVSEDIIKTDVTQSDVVETVTTDASGEILSDTVATKAERVESEVVVKEVLDKDIEVYRRDSDSRMHTQPISLKFTNLTKGAGASIILPIKDSACWTLGLNREQFVGVRFFSEKSEILLAKSMTLNDKVFYFAMAEDSPDVCINLFVESDQTLLRGCVELPPGTMMTIESSFDRSTLLGLSSFAVSLKPC